jgi:hypothetical protein
MAARLTTRRINPNQTESNQIKPNDSSYQLPWQMGSLAANPAHGSQPMGKVSIGTGEGLRFRHSF